MLVIFDCDGVLVDSEPLANRCFADALRREGLDWTVEETMRRLMGRSLKACLPIVEAELGRALPDDFIDRLNVDTFAAFRAAPVRAVVGIGAALDAIAAAGVPHCVASSGGHDKMRLTLGLTGLWSRLEGRIFSASEVARGKPAPDLFLHAARRMGAAPDACIVIEDSAPGIVAARAAGMRALAYVGAPWTDRAALQAEGGELFDDMRALPQLLGLVVQA
ncbi:MAG: HAD-IA family hydrolase [Alphaproteobacteria bacterium]|nr:HAD-IA family hydrolase [Alphaproteobacteria bacterium]